LVVSAIFHDYASSKAGRFRHTLPRHAATKPLEVHKLVQLIGTDSPFPVLSLSRSHLPLLAGKRTSDCPRFTACRFACNTHMMVMRQNRSHDRCSVRALYSGVVFSELALHEASFMSTSWPWTWRQSRVWYFNRPNSGLIILNQKPDVRCRTYRLYSIPASSRILVLVRECREAW
jgi:hypothetical protein